jgi:O-antigen ligase
MAIIKNRWAGTDSLDVVRSLLLFEFVALLVSTSVTVGTELIISLVFLASPALRQRLWRVGRQPMVLMVVVWIGVLVIAGLYSIAPRAETLWSLSSWRKILLLPMAAAVFDSDLWKRRLVWALVLTVTLGAVLSDISWFSGLTLYKYPRSIAIHNHATQGMMFAVGLFAIALLARYSRPETKGRYYFLPLAGLIIGSNLIFITPGRSGYLVLLVLAAVGAFCMVTGKFRYLLGLGVPLGMALLLFFSPVASQRVMKGVNEIRNYEHSAELTSMGIRVVMWKNTLAMVEKRPWLGYGTGGFSEAYRRQVEGQEGWQGQPVDDCHNQFLRIVAEQGLLGLVVFLLFIATFFRQRVSGVFRIMGLGVLLAWCATSMFSAHFSTFTEGRFLYLWCGAMLAANGRNEDQATT